MKRKASLLLSEMRPKQWTKNLLVCSAPLFNGSMFQRRIFVRTASAFIAFCLAAASIYIINDIYDLPKDRLNPAKLTRPIAAGTLGIKSALAGSLACMVLGLAAALALNASCFALLLSYLAVNLLYTIKLKHVVIVDVMIIAYGFVARAVAGALASGVKLTSWFLLCVMFLSLFLALGKRRSELLDVQEARIAEGRDVLKFYTLELLDVMINVVTSAMIMSYALFAAENREMGLTIPVVLYGVFYYLYVLHVKRGGGSPDEALYKERPILFTVLVYVVYVAAVRSFS